MRTKQARQTPADLCDTVAHTPPSEATSSAPDPRAVKSGQALRAALLTLLEHKPLEQITIREIAADPAVQQRFLKAGARCVASTPEEARARGLAERPMWKEMVHISGAKPE